MLLILAVAYCGAACSELPDSARTLATARPRAAQLILTDSACRAVTITLVGNNGVSLAFPNRAGCPGGLVLIPAGIASRGGSGMRTISIPIRLLNRTGYMVKAPATLVLAPSGRVVQAPSGDIGTEIVPSNHDRRRSDTGEWVWRVGTERTVALNDSTSRRIVSIRLESPATSALVTFSMEGTQLTPEGWPLLTSAFPRLDARKLVRTPGTDVIMFRTAAILEFNDGVSDAAKQMFFARNSMKVLGVTSDGEYFVTIPDPGTSITAFEAYFASLSGKPGILRALPALYSGLKPVLDSRIPADAVQRDETIP